jgi:hypothetical protein
MKILSKVFYVLGFILEYVIPILLFGFVTPLVHGKLDEGLTTVGIIAVAALALILLGKIKTAVLEWDKSLFRAIILSAIKAVPIIVIALALNWLGPFIDTLTTYMWRIIPLFIIGCFFDMAAEYLDAKEAK